MASQSELRIFAQSNQSTGPRPTEPRSVSALVAIIEDDEDAGAQLERALRRIGYRTLVFVDGQEALRAMERGPKPDLILLDLVMPGMDGWTFRVEQRASAQLREIPVIVMSGDASPKAAAIDADAYVQKPCPLERLRPVVEQVLSAAERKRLLAKGLELERLRSLGMLVGSVAHEVNNPLVYVGGNLELAARDCQRLREHPEEARELADALELRLKAALEGADRIAEIVKSLLTFARPETVSERADVARSLEAAISLSLPSLRNKAKLVKSWTTLPPVRGSEARLGQVFLNLLINAAQAVKPGAPDKNQVEIRAFHKEGHVIVEISDTGSGIAPEILNRVFEPFFTSKSEMGTGLGLSISKEIVESSGGHISIRSELGKGTTVRVELLVATGQVAHSDEPRRREEKAPAERLRILVVDDEPMVCKLVSSVLQDHDVQTFLEPATALAHVGNVAFDLVLCDWLMPSMTGGEFHRALTAARPDLASRFVLMTGAANSEDLDAFMRRLPHPVLRKPFSTQTLSEFVRRIAQTQANARVTV